MREVVIAANWKMHTTPADAGELARTIASRTREPGVIRVICPPFVCLAAVRERSPSDPDVAVGAQNVHHELAGAYTGEISAPMLVGLATWVIVGHSERRRDAGETDALIGRKLGRALDAGLRPILCVGEQLAEREAGRARRRRRRPAARLRSAGVDAGVRWATAGWSSPTSRSGRSAPAATRAALDAAAMADAIRASLAGLAVRAAARTARALRRQRHARRTSTSSSPSRRSTARSSAVHRSSRTRWRGSSPVPGSRPRPAARRA